MFRAANDAHVVQDVQILRPVAAQSGASMPMALQMVAAKRVSGFLVVCFHGVPPYFSVPKSAGSSAMTAATSLALFTRDCARMNSRTEWIWPPTGPMVQTLGAPAMVV